MEMEKVEKFIRVSIGDVWRVCGVYSPRFSSVDMLEFFNEMREFARSDGGSTEVEIDVVDIETILRKRGRRVSGKMVEGIMDGLLKADLNRNLGGRYGE